MFKWKIVGVFSFISKKRKNFYIPLFCKALQSKKVQFSGRANLTDEGDSFIKNYEASLKRSK